MTSIGRILLRAAVLTAGSAAATAIGLGISSGAAQAHDGHPVRDLLGTVGDVVHTVLPADDTPRTTVDQGQPPATPHKPRPHPIRHAVKAVTRPVVKPVVKGLADVTHPDSDGDGQAQPVNDPVAPVEVEPEPTPAATVPGLILPRAATSLPAAGPSQAVASCAVDSCTLADRRAGDSDATTTRHTGQTTDQATPASPARPRPSTPHPGTDAATGATAATTSPPTPVDATPTASWHPTPQRAGPIPGSGRDPTSRRIGPAPPGG